MKNELTNMDFINQISDEQFNALYEVTKMLNAANLEEELFQQREDCLLNIIPAKMIFR